MADKRIGEILVELGYVAPERLAEAAAMSASFAPAGAHRNGDGPRFGEHLCRAGLAREDDIAHALAVQCAIPVVDLADIRIPAEALQCVPAELAARYRVLPLEVTDDELHLAMANPFDMRAVDDLRMISSRQIARFYARPSDLAEAHRRHYGTSAARMADSLAARAGPGTEDPDEAVGHLHELAREPSLINLVNLIILEAVQDKASDIHIEPFERRLKVKYRIDGLLHEMAPPPRHLQAAIISRIKIMAQLNIAERFVPQDGHIKFTAAGAQVDIRVSTVPTMYGESVVMRILDKSSTLRALGELGMDRAMLRTFESVLQRPHGILLVTGPTGSGKTTTLYAGLNQIYTPGKKIITIEDPVEFHLEGINQLQVNPRRGLTFANGLRAILRQDPDIIMVGEIRDAETADIAIRSALTGHLVFSTLHTNDAPSAITRLLDMGIEPFLLATTVEAVVAQRLVRVLCPRCTESYAPSPQVLEQLGPDAEAFRGAALRRGRGCQECHHTGYRGRLGIFEMLAVTDAVREVVMGRPSSSQVRRAAGPGFHGMRRDGYLKVLAGVTGLEEVWRVTQDVNGENGGGGVGLGV